ncbi:MAG: hypothetical protein ACI4DV_04565 [Lachnospiraceae bacterium]
MSDEELLRMIEEIESGPIHKAPEYLKELTLQKLQAQPEKAAGSAGKQLIFYSLRVSAAVAASLLLLFSIPQPQMSIPSERNGQSVMQMVSLKTDEFCVSINQWSNKLVSMEEYER